jgi:hypothetical protein
MRNRERVLSGLLTGTITAIAVFTAIWIRPPLQQLLYFVATLCGAGFAAQMILRWMWGRANVPSTATGVVFGWSMAAYAMLELKSESSSTLLMMGPWVLLIILAVHIRTKRSEIAGVR